MIHVARMGVPGGLPAVLAHCFLGHSGGWKRLLTAMTTPLDARAFDLPGHGRSAPWGGGDLHARATAALAAQIEAPAVLMGHSFGATLALRQALEQPQSVRALVLVEPVFFAAACDMPEFGPHRAAEAPLRAAMARGEMAQAAALFFELNGDEEGWRNMPEVSRASMIARMPMLAASSPVLNDDAAGMATPGRLEGLTCPVLLLAGAASPPIFGAIARALARRLPMAQAQTVPGAGHMAPITHPQAVAGLIDGWLQPVVEKARPRAG
ncbi:MAG: alpha/beta fold hydrolase [Pararhodobacter sp.]